MTAPFVGEIKMFAGNFAPLDYATCDGQLLAISQNTALFSILGTTYGGNGTTNFGLPDMRGRSPVHPGSGLGLSPIVEGEMSGVENVTILSSNLPSHSHNFSLSASSANGTSGTPAPGTVMATSTARDRMYSTNAPDTTMLGGVTGLSGNNIPLSIRNPFLAVNFIIALFGVFPSRN